MLDLFWSRCCTQAVHHVRRNQTGAHPQQARKPLVDDQPQAQSPGMLDEPRPVDFGRRGLHEMDHIRDPSQLPPAGLIRERREQLISRRCRPNPGSDVPPADGPWPKSVVRSGVLVAVCPKPADTDHEALGEAKTLDPLAIEVRIIVIDQLPSERLRSIQHIHHRTGRYQDLSISHMQPRMISCGPSTKRQIAESYRVGLGRRELFEQPPHRFQQQPARHPITPTDTPQPSHFGAVVARFHELLVDVWKQRNTGGVRLVEIHCLEPRLPASRRVHTERRI